MIRIIAVLTGALVVLAGTGTVAGDFEYGFKLGLPISTIHLSNLPSAHVNLDKPDIWRHAFTSRVGANISLYGGFYLSRKVHLRIEPGYIKKGAKFDMSNARLDLHYWNLPVVFKYRPSSVLGVCVGPAFSRLAKATLDYDSRQIDMFDSYEKLEASLLIGLELQTADGFAFGLRDNRGLTKRPATVWRAPAAELDAAFGDVNRTPPI